LCRISIIGNGFTTAARGFQVLFGDIPASSTTLVFNNQGLVNVFLPPAPGPGPVSCKVRILDGDGGIGQEAVLDPCFTYFNALAISDVSPNVVTSLGGTTVTLQGTGFEAGQVVTFGGRAATNVVVAADGASLTAVTPPGVAGRVDVEVVSRFGTAKRPLGLRYVAPLQVERVMPAAGALAGGNQVLIQGHGFTDEVSITFGALPARLLDFAGENEIRVAAPAASTLGPVDVVVSESYLSQTSTLAGGYTYVGDVNAPALYSVTPSSGPTSGGTVVHLLGRKLSGTNVDVKFGAVSAGTVAVVDADHLTAVSPLAPAGTVDVSVTRDGTTLTLVQAFTYGTRVKLTGVMPASGPAAGGTNLEITGANLDQACTFTLGGQPLTVTVSTSSTATAAAPAGSPGSVDLLVTCPAAGEATLANAFAYAGPLSVLSVEPIRGAISGGTFVNIRGTGFSSRPSLRVLFGMEAAGNVDVRSDSLIQAYTPPHAGGAVDVTVVAGTESSVRARAFVYYDPSGVLGGTRGGPINGSVNVQAIDYITGNQLPGALVVLGTDQGGQYTAFTDERGQAPLSGPDVFGAQTVTVAHCNYQYVTVSGVNAADITVWMCDPLGCDPRRFPPHPPRCGSPPPPQTSPPGPTPPPPPVISGKVFGFAKELFDPANLGPDEFAAAFVYHTWPSPFSYPPSTWSEAPSQAVFVEGGTYEIPAAWHTGPMAIVAFAGIYNTTTNAFRVAQMGFHRGLVADLGGVYRNRDINLSIPLTKRLTVQFPDAPYQAPNTLNNVMLAYVNLGGEGAHPVPGWRRDGINGELQYVLENFAEAPGDLFTFIAQFSSNTASQKPYSLVIQDGQGQLGDAIALAPLMGFPVLEDPVENGAMNHRTMRVKTPTGQRPSFYEFTINAQDGTALVAYMEGNHNKIILPTFPSYPTNEYAPFNLPPGGITGSLEAVFVPGFDYNNWSYLELWGVARRSWSNADFRFVNAGN
jgi:hypothetical protein